MANTPIIITTPTEGLTGLTCDVFLEESDTPEQAGIVLSEMTNRKGDYTGTVTSATDGIVTVKVYQSGALMFTVRDQLYDTTATQVLSGEQLIQAAGGGGGGDWTDTEKEHIRYRLQFDGTQSAPTADAPDQLPCESTAANITSDGNAINATGGVIDTVNLVNTTTTNTDMRGTDGANTIPPLDASATATAVWDALLVSHNVVGSFGASINSAGAGPWTTAVGFSTHTAEDVWTVASRTVTAATNITSDGAAIGVTGGIVNRVTLVDTTTANTDMRGTDNALLAASAPANFGDLAITVTTGEVTVGTNNDKNGYGLAGVQIFNNTGQSTPYPSDVVRWQSTNLTGISMIQDDGGGNSQWTALALSLGPVTEVSTLPAEVWAFANRGLTTAANITSDATPINVSAGVVAEVNTVQFNADMRGTDGANTVVPDNTQGAAVIAHGDGLGAWGAVADVSALALEATSQAILTGLGDGSIVVGTVNDKAGYALSATGLDLVLVAGVNVPEALRRIGTSVIGTVSGAGTPSEVFADWALSPNTIVVSADDNGNRTNVSYN